jgi:hypothetical protein
VCDGKPLFLVIFCGPRGCGGTGNEVEMEKIKLSATGSKVHMNEKNQELGYMKMVYARIMLKSLS